MGGADGRVVIDMQLKDQQAQKGVKSMKGGLLGLAKVVAAAFATKQVINWGKQLAMSANKVRMIERQFDTTFGNSAGVATANIDRIANSIGMLPGRVTPAFTKFSQSWLMAGKSMEESMSLSESMLKISADAAAAFGMSFDDASGALQSFMKGNTQAGLALRINTSQVEIQQWALENLGLEWENLDEAQRKVARMDFVKYMYENGNITGFAAQASRDYYNVLGNLQQAWLELQAILGDRILDLVIDGMLLLTDIILGAIDIIPKLVQGFRDMRESAQRFEPVIEKVVAGIAAMIIVKKATTWIKALKIAMQKATIASRLITTAKLKQGVAAKKLMIATKGQTASSVANAVAIKGSTLAIGVMTGKIKAKQAAMAILNTITAKYPVTLKAAAVAMKAFNAVMAAGKSITLLYAGAFTMKSKAIATGKAIIALAKITMKAFKAVKLLLKGPIGWITAGIIALTAGIVALIRWFRRTSDESKQLKSDISNLTDAIESNNEALADSESAYQSSLSSIRANASANRELATTVTNLAEQESESAAQRAILNGQLDQLSAALGGVVLYYNKETGALNMSNEELQNRINLLEAQESKNAGLERQSQLLREKHEVEMKKVETNELLRRAIDLYGENSDRVQELTDIYDGLNATYEELEARLEVTSQAVYDHATAVAHMTDLLCNEIDRLAQAVQEGTWMQVVSWDELSDAQRSAVDRMVDTYNWLADNATNALNKIDTSTEVTMASMIETLNHNIEYTRQWGYDMATLYERAGQSAPEGFLPWIEELERQTPGILNQVANGCQAELNELIATFEAAGEASKGSLSTALGEEFSEVMQLVERFGPEAGESLRASIEAADFEGIGKGIGEGTGAGIASATPEAAREARAMGEAIIEEGKASLRSSSPSMAFKDIGKGIPEGVGMGVTANADAAISPVSDLADMMLSAFEDGLSGMDQIALSSFTGISNSARTGMTQMVSTVSSNTQRGATALNAGLTQMNSSAQSNMNNIQTTATSGMTRMSTAITQGATQSNQAMTQGLTQMNNTTRTNMQTMQTTTTQGMTQISTAISQGAMQSNQAMTQGMNQMNSSVQSNMSNIQSSVSNGMSGFTSAISGGMSSAQGAVNSGNAGMISAVNSLASQFHSAGANAASSLAAGINSRAGAAIAAAQAMANAVASATRAAMQIASPSRIMKRIGQFTGEGFIVGMEDKLRAIKEIANKMAMAALPEPRDFRFPDPPRFAPNSRLSLPKLKAESLIHIGKKTGGGVAIRDLKSRDGVTHNYDNRGIFEGATIIWNNAQDIRETMEEMMFIVQTEEARLV